MRVDDLATVWIDDFLTIEVVVPINKPLNVLPRPIGLFNITCPRLVERFLGVGMSCLRIESIMNGEAFVKINPIIASGLSACARCPLGWILVWVDS